jgi:hypothetical protein
MMGWETPMPDVMLKFLNTFLIKDIYIYFGHKDKVYVIIKKLIVYVFGMCAKGYVEKPKRQVNKSLAVHALQSCKLALANSSTYQWNANSFALPYFVRYPTIKYVI